MYKIDKIIFVANKFVRDFWATIKAYNIVSTQERLLLLFLLIWLLFSMMKLENLGLTVLS